MERTADRCASIFQMISTHSLRAARPRPPSLILFSLDGEAPYRLSMFAFHAAIVAALVAIWFLITGRLAESAHRQWSDSHLGWLFLGGITELRTLKRFHRWLGIMLLLLVIIVYIGTIYHASRP